MPQLRRIFAAAAIRAAVLCGGMVLGYLFCPRTLPAAPHNMATDLPDQPPLNRLMGAVALRHATLAQVAQLIRERTGANVFLRPPVAGDEAPGEPTFDIDLTDLTLGELLDAVTLWDSTFSFEYENGVLSLWRSAAGSQNTRVYPIGDLLDDRALWRNFPDKSADTDQEREDLLHSQIAGTIDPDSWRDAGGAVGALRILNRDLIVTQSPQAQDEVGDLLEVLRRIRDAQQTRSK